MKHLFVSTLLMLLSQIALADHHKNAIVTQQIAVAKTFFALDTPPARADVLLQNNFEFVFMGREPISNVIYAKETFPSVLMNQVFSRRVPQGFKKIEFTHAFGDADNVALMAEGDAEGINGRYNNNYALILRFKDGKIHRLDEYASVPLLETAPYKQQLMPMD